MQKRRLSICVASPDAYDDILTFFVEAYQRYCNDCPYELILSTQTKKYHGDGIKTLNSFDVTDNWTLRMLSALKYCRTKYILLMCDDIIFTDKPNFKAIEIILDNMDHLEAVFCGLMNQISGKSLSNEVSLVCTKGNQAYALNLQCGIFEREFLLEELGTGELSPWDIEKKWLHNTKNMKNEYSTKVLSCRKNILNCVHCISKGKWIPNSIRQLNRSGIQITTQRQVITRSQALKMMMMKTFGKKMTPQTRKFVKSFFAKLGVQFTTEN